MNSLSLLRLVLWATLVMPCLCWSEPEGGIENTNENKDGLSAQTSLLALSKGDYWKYEVRLTVPKGHPISQVGVEPTEKKGRLEYQLKEKREYQGLKSVTGLLKKVHAIFIYKEPNELLREAQYLRIEKDGLFAMGSSMIAADGSSQHVILEQPMPIVFKEAKPGVKWTWSTKSKTKNQKETVFDFRVMLEKEVEVFAGKFLARHIQVLEKLEGKIVSKTDYWFADQVGMIKEVEERYLAADLMVTRSSELLECQVKLNDLNKKSVKTNAKPLGLK